MIIDGGGAYDGHFDFGRNVIAPFLLYRGVTEISRIILTHPHPDHAGGLPYLLYNFPVRELWITKDTAMAEATTQLLDLARKRQVPHPHCLGRHTG